MFRWLAFIIFAAAVLLVGCGPVGGGRDAVTVDLPFAAPYRALCTQGPGGAYSHHFRSTKHDLDLDTPNDRDDPVYSPVHGVAYVHNDGATTGFGTHVNIDMHDGTFLLIGHLKSASVTSGSEVAPGTLLGVEGSTGAASGDHVHFGRHAGDPTVSASRSESLPNLTIAARDVTAGTPPTALPPSAFLCGLQSGHVYESVLAMPLQHPDGSLVKTAAKSTVYLVDSGRLRLFVTESAFLTRRYSFADVIVITEAERACYQLGDPIAGDAQLLAAKDALGDAWLVRNFPSEGVHDRLKLSRVGWQAVLKTWGITASTYDDLPPWSAADLGQYPMNGWATYRSGSVVSPVGKSDVFVMSGGFALPIIDWDTFLFLGFSDGRVIEVNDDEWRAVAPPVGDCALGIRCLTRDVVSTCATSGQPIDDPAESDDSVLADTDLPAPDDESPPVDTEEPEDDDPPAATPDTLRITWRSPTGATMSRITMSGEFTPAGGYPQGWSPNLVSVSGASSVTYTRTVQRGDKLRFSVEFASASGVSWSCLGPFPPGVTQGVVTASVGNASVLVTPVADPASAGCGLQVVVP